MSLSRSRSLSQLVALIAVAAATSLAPGAQGAAQGDLDPGFGSGGLVTTPFAGGDAACEAVALQPDGRIVAAGYSRDAGSGVLRFMIARYDAKGALDPSFGTGGIATTTVGSGSAANALALQADGKIVAGGFTQDYPGQFALARFNTNGTLDSTFGSGGKVVTNIGSANNEINAVAIEPDGKIVVGGGDQDAGDHALNFVVARYQANGSLDATFGSGGIAFTNFGRGGIARGLTLQSDGKIVEVGPAGLASYPFGAFGLVRFNDDGSLDTGFGVAGKATTSFAGGAGAWAVVQQPDGRLIVVGEASTNTNNGGFGLARYNTDGSLDTSFGTGGTVLTDFGSASDPAHAVALRSDGKIVVAGHWVTPGYSGDFALAQYAADGSLDPSFGVGGKVTTNFSGASSSAYGLAIEPDGKVVAAGVAAPSSGNAVFALARYTGVGLPGNATINVVSPADGGAYRLDKRLTAKFKCTDKSSGVVSCAGTVANGAPVDTSTIGSHSFTVTATDLAGNTTVTTVHYTVVYTWNGFFSPIGNEADVSLNLVHAGDLVKIGFGLDGDRGLAVLASVTSVPVACPAWTPHIVPAAGAAAGAGLAFGVSSSHYVFGWQTSTGWAGTCREFQLTLNDGTAAHTAVFMFFA